MVSVSAPILGSTPRKQASKLQVFAAWLLGAKTQNPKVASQHRGDGIKIVCISDTHNTKLDLPDGDVLLHAGDLSKYGTFAEIKAQLEWLRSCPHKHKIVIAGNHDLLLDQAFVHSHPDRELDRRGTSKLDLDWGDITYLEDSSITIHVRGRAVSIFGSPWTPRCGNFAFQYDESDDLWRNRIPLDTDIVLIHGPPAAYLDAGKGCESLLHALHHIKPELAVFGHIHEARGQATMYHDQAHTSYEDIMIGRTPRSGLFRLLFWAFCGRFFVEDSAPSTLLINAAMIPADKQRGASGAVLITM